MLLFVVACMILIIIFQERKMVNEQNDMMKREKYEINAEGQQQA